jgi:tetratricopeptide (TPR) repeat protein
VAFREAYALAAEGKLPEALEYMEKIRVKFPMARHLFLGRVASVYQHAGEFDKQLACAREALEAGPKRSLEWVDFATCLAWRDRDIAGAKEALNQARKFEMAEIVKAATLKCSGLIALADRDFARAHDDLRLAVVGLTEHASTPLGECLTTETKALLAVAAAYLGRYDEAKALWGQAEPILKARKESWVIGKYAEAIASARSLK